MVMEQCLFDELVLFLLETISSEEYLTSIGIHRPDPLGTQAWEKFKKNVRDQTVVPGIYARKIGNSAHYYAVRQDVNRTVANGYPSKAGLDKRYAIGLDAQKDHSHGLCQTYALMFYTHQDHLLKKSASNYFKNVMIGLNFLRDFIDADYYNRERCWSPEEMYDNMNIICDNHDDERFENLKKIHRTEICLTDIVKVLLANEHRGNLKTWFDEY